MIFFEPKFENINVVNQFGITNKTINDNGYAFDSHSEVDLNRLSRFITFDIKFRKRKPNGNSQFIRAKHR